MHSLSSETTEKPEPKTVVFLATREDIVFNKKHRYFTTEHYLAILSWLIHEVSKAGGKASHLLPNMANYQAKPDFLIPTHKREENLKEILVYALETLPNGPEVGQAAATQKALQAIIAKWGTKRKGWSTMNHTEETRGKSPSFPRIEGLAQRTLTVELNNSHPMANRIYDVEFYFNSKGRVFALITHGYPRDCSSWTWGARDAEYAEEYGRIEVATFLKELSQKPGESRDIAIARITEHIEAHTIEGITSPRWYPSLGRTNNQRIIEEETYSQLEKQLRVRGDFSASYIKPDEGTKARFGGNKAYGRNEEVASMLAELLHDPKRTEAELEVLTAGLKRTRQIGLPNKTLCAFVDTLANRNYGHPTNKDIPPPNYELLKSGIAQAQAVKGKVLVWIPRKGHMTGLKRVPWNQVQLNRRNHKITHKGITQDVGEIRQFDVI